MNDHLIYPNKDFWGYYGKDLWADFCNEYPDLSKDIASLLYLLDHSSDPILNSYSHFQHKCYRVACLLGMATWPSEEEVASHSKTYEDYVDGLQG